MHSYLEVERNGQRKKKKREDDLHLRNMRTNVFPESHATSCAAVPTWPECWKQYIVPDKTDSLG